MERTNFEKLRVYTLAETLADQVWDIVRKWEYLAKDTVGKQLVRAVDSVGANIAEGNGTWQPGRQSKIYPNGAGFSL